MPLAKADLRESPCPRCGGDARDRFLDESKSRVEVQCPDCGRFLMSRERFDEAALDVVEAEFE